jgi:hypothetical protein
LAAPFVSLLFIPKFCSWRVRLACDTVRVWLARRRSARLVHSTQMGERVATGLFAPDSIHLYDHAHALLPMGIERLHVFAMQERD